MQVQPEPSKPAVSAPSRNTAMLPRLRQSRGQTSAPTADAGELALLCVSGVAESFWFGNEMSCCVGLAGSAVQVSSALDHCAPRFDAGTGVVEMVCSKPSVLLLCLLTHGSSVHGQRLITLIRMQHDYCACAGAQSNDRAMPLTPAPPTQGGPYMTRAIAEKVRQQQQQLEQNLTEAAGEALLVSSFNDDAHGAVLLLAH